MKELLEALIEENANVSDEKIPMKGNTFTYMNPGFAEVLNDLNKEANEMNRLFDAANRYLKDCSWKDIAVLKFCLIALGVLLGIAVPARKKKASAWAASLAAFSSSACCTS